MDVSLGLNSTNETNSEDMNKNVQWKQFVVAVFAVIISTWGIVYMYTRDLQNDARTNATQVENHEQRIKQLENDRQELKADIKDIKQSQQQVLILLQNKQDRKN